MSALMAAVWLIARKVNNYSVVDAAWAFCFPLQTAIFALFAGGWSVRTLIIFTMVNFWGCRLGSFLYRRIRSHHPTEDTRYNELRRGYEPNVARRFFLFFQYQAWSVTVLTIPFLLICLNPEPELSLFEIVGFFVWAFSLIGEAISDNQMAQFKKDPANKGRTCEIGLWKYSRHPNYFFESCIWWGYFLFALGSPNGVFTLYAPLAILFLLLKVTGVPPAEAQSLRSRGDAYRDYQRRTSVFIPWFPRR